MSSKLDKLTRRDFLKLAATVTGGGIVGGAFVRYRNLWQQPSTRVMTLKAVSYKHDLVDLMRRGVQNFPSILQRIKGNRVVLKPNLVEYYGERCVNTNPLFVAAAIETFRSLGAGEVIVAEGPGHRRDMELLLEASGLQDVLYQEKVNFVDLNLDSIAPVQLKENYTQLGALFLPKTILGADLVISMPKLKTHHWAGVTLSLKNMFGTVPGVKYGWPKNALHWCGIDNSIVDINLAVKPDFAIVDGIDGMQGDGPLYGETVHAGVIVMGDNLTAVDATAARIMGIYPEHIPHLLMMQRHGGTVHASRISQIGEPVSAVQQDFSVLSYWDFVKQPLPFIRKLFLIN